MTDGAASRPGTGSPLDPSAEGSVWRVGPEGKERPSLRSDAPVNGDIGTSLEVLCCGTSDRAKVSVLVQACAYGLVQVALGLLNCLPGYPEAKAWSAIGVVTYVNRALSDEFCWTLQIVYTLITGHCGGRRALRRRYSRRCYKGNWKSQGRYGGEYASHPDHLEGWCPFLIVRFPHPGCISGRPSASSCRRQAQMQLYSRLSQLMRGSARTCSPGTPTMVQISIAATLTAATMRLSPDGGLRRCRRASRRQQ